MGGKQQKKSYAQRQGDKKQDRYKNVVAKQKAKGAPKLKKSQKNSPHFQPKKPPIEGTLITGEFAKAWTANRKKAFYTGWAIGASQGAIVALAVAYVLGHLK